MKYINLTSFAQDAPERYGNNVCCNTPSIEDILKEIVIAMEMTEPGSQEEKDLYEKMNKELTCEIFHELVDPQIKKMVTVEADDPTTYTIYHNGEKYRMKVKLALRISSENEELIDTVQYAISKLDSTFALAKFCVAR